MALQSRTLFLLIVGVVCALVIFTFYHSLSPSDNDFESATLINQLRSENEALRKSIKELSSVRLENLLIFMLKQRSGASGQTTNSRHDANAPHVSRIDECTRNPDAPIVRPKRHPIGKPGEIPKTIPPEALDEMTTVRFMM